MIEWIKNHMSIYFVVMILVLICILECLVIQYYKSDLDHYKTSYSLLLEESQSEQSRLQDAIDNQNIMIDKLKASVDEYTRNTMDKTRSIQEDTAKKQSQLTANMKKDSSDKKQLEYIENELREFSENN